MKRFLKTRFYSLVLVKSEMTNDEILGAYDEFIDEINNYTTNTKGYSHVFRYLSFTHIEIDSLKNHFLCEKEKKCT